MKICQKVLMCSCGSFSLKKKKKVKFENVKTQENITWCLDEISSETNSYTMKLILILLTYFTFSFFKLLPNKENLIQKGKKQGRK